MRRALASVLLVLASASPGWAAPPSVSRQASEVERIRREVRSADDLLQVVEKQYAYRPEPGEEESLKRRYSDAEIQFLLNNYQVASVLLYDLLGSTAFRGMREYSDALYMLAESLYQNQNYLGARLYFREHMNLRGSHYRDALSRYLDISGRLNEFTGIDQYIEQAKGPNGALPADVAYVYAKWLFRRTDLQEADRVARSRQAFQAIAEAGGAFALQAWYFLGVLAVQKSDLAGAANCFETVLKLPARSARDKKVQELANLSLGRVYYEQAKYTEAVDRYQEIDYSSDSFVDALYEIAWTHVKRSKANGPGEFEKANQACEKLLLAAPESLLAPEARILQGHLLLKLGKYQEANEAYTSIINAYLEVYDNIDGRLKAFPDPIQYFQKVIQESGKTFDINAFLPPIAVKWATTSRDVAEAVQMTSDIDASKKSVAESNEIAQRLLDVLARRELEVFPQFQEGYSRAEAVDSSLAKLEGELLQIEESLLGPERTGGIRKELEAVRKERAALEQRFRDLPKTEREIEARRAKMTEQLAALDQEIFRLGYQVEGLYAVLTALEKFVADTRDQRPSSPEDEREFANRMRQEREVANQLRDELALMKKQARDERAKLGLMGTGDEKLRAQYEQLMSREQQLLASVRGGLGDDAAGVARSMDELRGSIAQLKQRSAAAKKQIREAVKKKAEGIREKVLAEAQLLRGYEAEVNAASRGAQDLVGSIAYESFKRVRRQFYELVLKADVGLVDVAWTRKQDKTNQIQALAKQKDKEIRGLDDEFKEVLKEVE